MTKPTPSERWQQYLDRLPLPARTALERAARPAGLWTATPTQSQVPKDSEESFAFQQYLSRLPAGIAARVQAAAGVAPALAAARPGRLADYAAGFGHFAVVAVDGEWAELRRYRDELALAADMAAADGTDVQFIGGYGVIYPISKGPSRVMLTHEGDAIQITPAVAMVADLMDTELQLQDNFFLGDEALSPEIVRRPHAAELAALARPAAEADYARDAGAPDDGDDDAAAATS